MVNFEYTKYKITLVAYSKNSLLIYADPRRSTEVS